MIIIDVMFCTFVTSNTGPGSSVEDMKVFGCGIVVVWFWLGGCNTHPPGQRQVTGPVFSLLF